MGNHILILFDDKGRQEHAVLNLLYNFHLFLQNDIRTFEVIDGFRKMETHFIYLTLVFLFFISQQNRKLIRKRSGGGIDRLLFETEE